MGVKTTVPTGQDGVHVSGLTRLTPPRYNSLIGLRLELLGHGLRNSTATWRRAWPLDSIEEGIIVLSPHPSNQ
ncbi:hypothetical protein PHLCEN_2v1394 [Hermanssonia centrifuga]|uniref:Uncharacterized protein n=1 Tax=Hermanssonia centrifuga TaxID=98765 RepID=A0A2R6S3C3_9APHY|nr:hypothetical protein PHLCEN_2v1394 [Hermanssonia centrifuga]